MGNVVHSIKEMFDCFQEMFQFCHENTERNKMLKIKEQERAQYMSELFMKEILPLRDNAMIAYQNWVGTASLSVPNILIMLVKYSKYRFAVKQHKNIPLEKLIPVEDLDEYAAIEMYRQHGMSFWYDFGRLDFSKTSTYKKPFIGEMIEFSTFHWAIYMANNICAELPDNKGREPITYTLVLDLLDKVSVFDKKDNRTPVLVFRESIQKHFQSIHQFAFDYESELKTKMMKSAKFF